MWNRQIKLIVGAYNTHSLAMMKQTDKKNQERRFEQND